MVGRPLIDSCITAQRPGGTGHAWIVAETPRIEFTVGVNPRGVFSGCSAVFLITDHAEAGYAFFYSTGFPPPDFRDAPGMFGYL
jgi:hypothetical protein